MSSPSPHSTARGRPRRVKSAAFTKAEASERLGGGRPWLLLPVGDPARGGSRWLSAPPATDQKSRLVSGLASDIGGHRRLP
jgi:hypothetical protein